VALKLCIFLLLTAVLTAPAVHADWINLTGSETAPNIAEIYVLNDRVHVKLEVYIGDLDKFEDLVPDDWLRDAGGRDSLDERLERFSREGLQFVTDTGEQLIAEVVAIEPRLRVDRQSPFAGMINPITRARVPEAPADKRVLYVELDYPFLEQPKTLRMIPPLDPDSDIAAATIGFIAYHKSVPVIDFRYLGAAAELTLDVVFEVQERQPKAPSCLGADDVPVCRALRGPARSTDTRERSRGMDGSRASRR
jgi:hypothetical protein